MKYDVLALLNTLTGDRYYVWRHPGAYRHFEPLLTRQARATLADLRAKFKHEGEIISALLALYFSATEDETLGDMLATVRDSGPMRDRLRQTPYYDEREWRLYESVRPSLQVILQWLIDVDFPKYWDTRARGRAEKKIARIGPQLSSCDVVEAAEQVLGRELPSDTITVHVLVYVKPHGIRITGSRFLTDVSYPSGIVLSNAIHEMMHPPFDLESDAELRAAIEKLKTDPFVFEAFQKHDPKFGYNTFDGYVEEDLVRALDQLVSESFGVAYDPRWRWRQEGGMHVLAAALYSLMRKHEFLRSGVTARDFFVRQVETGDLQPGRVRSHYDAFYGEEARC